MQAGPGHPDQRTTEGTISYINSTRLATATHDRLRSVANAVDGNKEHVASVHQSESLKSTIADKDGILALQAFCPSKIDLNRNIVVGDRDKQSEYDNYNESADFNAQAPKGMRIVIPQPQKERHLQQYI